MVQNKRKLTFLLTTIIGCLALLFFATHGVHAQEAAGNLQDLQQASGLGNESFAVIIGRIIRVVLSVLGVITLGVVIFGGFLYMTSGGSEENIDKAKKVIANGVIGLAITLSAFAITQFVMSTLSNATGTQTGFNTTVDDGGNIDTGYGGIGGSSGTVSSGGLQVKTIIPRGDQTYANLKVSVIFTGIIDETSVSGNVKVTDGDADVPGSYAVSGDTVTFVPSTACPEPNQLKKCFAAGKEYKVTVTGGKGGIVSATTKKSLNCAGTSCSATFTAGSLVDVKGPTISNTEPKKNDKIPTDQIVPIKALLSDDNAVALGRITINGVVLESIAAVPDKDGLLQEFGLFSKKFSTKGDAANKSYKIAITAEDVAGNSTTLDFNVLTSPQHCFNKKIDGDEADIDCSAPGGECGLCTNIACKADIDCAGSAVCDATKKSCVAVPIIKLVQPQDGAPGTYVTIGGQGFGTQFGEVVFLGDTASSKDDTVAGPACNEGWSDTQAVVTVPADAVTGPIEIRNAAGSLDTTDDADGLKLSKFVVNDVERPGLCAVSPVTGLPGSTKITVSGNDFLGNSALERKLFVGGYLIEKAVWGEAGTNTVTGIIPPFEPAKVDVQVTIKSIASNPLELVVQAPDASVPPASLGGLIPNKGPVGQYVTINGSGFGTTPNKVYFVVVDASGKLTSDQTVADINFPQQCAKTFWKDNQIIVKVPQLAAGTYAVVVQPYGKTKQSTYKMFTVNSDVLGPQACALVSDSGPADGIIKVTMYGDNFGKDAGAIIFGDKIISKPVSGGLGWSNTAVTVVVPSGVVTGEVKLAKAQTNLGVDACTKNPALCSNPMKYTVLDCRATQNSCAAGTMCCGNGSCQKDCAVDPAKSVKGVFAWCFSTGDSCDVVQPPRVVEECGAGIIPSPSPAALWPSTAQGGACSNSIISIKFSQAIDPQTVTINAGTQSSLLVEECSGSVQDNKNCETVAAQPLELTGLQVKEKVDAKNAGLFAIIKNLKPSTRYKVTLSNAIAGFDTGLALVGPDKALAGNDCKATGSGVYCYTFVTSAAEGQCDVDSVAVAPSSYKASTLGYIKDVLSKKNELMFWLPVPSPADKCQVLDANAYTWKWSPSKKLDKDFDFAEAAQSDSMMTSVVAKTPTAGKTDATISVKELKSGKIGNGSLSIDLGVPVITEECSINGPRSPSPSSQWGGEVCADAPIVVEFNQPVVNKGASGSESIFTPTVWECNGTTAGKECESLVKPQVEGSVSAYKFGDARYVYAFQPAKTLAKGVNYLVEVPATTKGEGQFGKSMTQKVGCRTGVAYCFTFKTTTDDTQCLIKSVEVSPFTWSATEYGVQQTFTKGGDLVDQMWHSQAFGKNQCVWLKNNYKWSWYVDQAHQSFAAINPAPEVASGESLPVGLAGKYWASNSDQNVAAYKETKVGDPVQIIASAEGVEGKSYMDIAFPSPTVLSYQPSACGGAGVCAAAAPSIEFSVKMNTQSISEHAFLYECPKDADGKANCDFTDSEIAKSQKLTASALLPAANSKTKNLIYVLSPAQKMKADTTYRVVLAAGIYSSANKSFAAFNYPEEKSKYYSWTFTVTQDQCAPKSISIHPGEALAKAQGDKQTFVASPYSAPDSCYPQGQLLDASKMYWAWGISDSKVVSFNVATSTNAQSFVMNGKGTVDLKDNTQSAILSASTGGVTGKAVWKMQCSSPPVDCPAGTWPGSDFCCHLPPKVSATYPASEKDICRNTLVTVDVTDWVDPKTVSPSTVRLGFATNNANECKDGTVENGICFGQIPYALATINQKSKNGDQISRIVLNLNQVLPADRKIVLQVRAVGADDPVKVGIKSTIKVPVLGTEVTFFTGTNFCELTDVKVFPEETNFTKLSDVQTMYSYGLSKQGSALVPLSAIPGTYSWSWKWITNSSKVAKFDGDVSVTSPSLVPGGANGQTTVAALATIDKDEIIKPSTAGKTVAGAATVDAMLCEVPWIAQNDPAVKPTLDSQNFDFWYCQSVEKAQLPKLVGVKDALSDIGANNFTTLESFRLIDPDGAGAIGFRVEKNLKQYSPLEWFYQKQFKGEPEAISVDGFAGVRSGNTVYIGFGNSTEKSQYTNILVVSLSEPSSPEMKNIFNQIIQGMQFARNIKDVGLCYAGSSPVNKMCSLASDCDPNQTCNVEQSKFRRDFLRVIDSSVMTRGINVVKASVGSYPIIAKDSFIAGLSSSRWPSWTAFMQQLGVATVVDPINEYTGCAGGSDPTTCWNVKAKSYQCANTSSVYHYRTVKSGVSYELGIPLEQTAGQQALWAGEWQANVKPALVNDFCVGQPVVAAAVCGDGAIGEGEECDPAGSNVSGSDIAACPAYAKFTAKCSATCKIEKLACVNLCGDGIVQKNVEDCDDGSKYNGQYNHCGLNCKFDNSLGSCGNGTVEKNEVCDIGTVPGRVFIDTQTLTTLQDSTNVGVRCLTAGNSEEVQYKSQLGLVLDGVASMNNGQKTNIYDKFLHQKLIDKCLSTEKVGECSGHKLISCFATSDCPTGSSCLKPVVGTKYAKAEANSCSWNCKATGSYCGDKVVDAANGEQCDGDERGNQCTKFCTADCKWKDPLVKNTTTQKDEPTCVADPAVAKAALAGCGDGVVTASSGEECDLGTACVPPQDPTTAACTVGGQNGVACVPQYGANNSCQYCTASCKKGYVSGGFCGDGKAQGPEECDKLSFGAVCNADSFDYHSFACTNSCTVDKKSGSCQSCAKNTTAFTKSKPTTGSQKAVLILNDETLGWLPGTTGVQVAFVRNNQLTPEIAPTTQNGYFFATIPTNATGIKQLPIEFDANSACVTDPKHYRVSVFGSSDATPDTKSIGGAFDYIETVKDFGDLTTLTNTTINAVPAGKEGDYRIVMDAPETRTFELTVASVLPPKSAGYSPPNIYSWETVGICKTNKALFQTTLAEDLERHVGCLIDAPYVEYDRAYKGDLKILGAKLPEFLSHILTIRKNGATFDNAKYILKVRGTGPLSTVKVFQYTNGQWTKKQSFAEFTRQGNNSWDVFYFGADGVIIPGKP